MTERHRAQDRVAARGVGPRAPLHHQAALGVRVHPAHVHEQLLAGRPVEPDVGEHERDFRPRELELLERLQRGRRGALGDHPVVAAVAALELLGHPLERPGAWSTATTAGLRSVGSAVGGESIGGWRVLARS